MAKSRPSIARSTLLALALLALVAGFLFLRPPRSLTPPPLASAPVPEPIPTQPRVTPAGASPANAAFPASGRSPVELQNTIAANLVPGRMLYLDFALDPAGVKLMGAMGAAGRAKTAPPSEGPGFIHYQVFDTHGRLVLTGSIDDPAQQRIEFPASSDDGRISSVTRADLAGGFAVRLPGESDAGRVVFYRMRGSPAQREPLGELVLRPSSP